MLKYIFAGKKNCLLHVQVVFTNNNNGIKSVLAISKRKYNKALPVDKDKYLDQVTHQQPLLALVFSANMCSCGQTCAFGGCGLNAHVVVTCNLGVASKLTCEFTCITCTDGTAVILCNIMYHKNRDTILHAHVHV